MKHLTAYTKNIEEEYEIALIDLIMSLAEIRAESGITRKELAEKVGITEQELLKIEMLSEIPDVYTLIKLVKALDAQILIRRKRRAR